jgi:hypothetical protein
MKFWLSLCTALLLFNSFYLMKSKKGFINENRKPIFDLSEVKSSNASKINNLASLLNYSKDMFMKLSPKLANRDTLENPIEDKFLTLHTAVDNYETSIPASTLENVLKHSYYNYNYSPRNLNFHKKKKREIIFIDDYYPLKYTKQFFENLMNNFQIKSEKNNIIENVKNLMTCKFHVTNQKLKLISKEPFKQIEISMRLQIASKEDDYLRLLKEILKYLGDIAKELSRVCKGPQEFIELVKDKILNINVDKLGYSKKSKIIKKQKYPNLKKDKLINHIAYSMRVHNFEESGKLLGMLINNILS